MEYATETIEIEEICEDGNPVKRFKQIVKGFDNRFVTNWKNDQNYKDWVEKDVKDGTLTTATTGTATVTAFQFGAGEPTECIELCAGELKNQIEVKSIKKAGSSNVVMSVRNNRSNKRQIRVIDPNLPAFVCTEHNENISLDCRYCRIASGYKKKCSQKSVQNDEISSTGKVTVAIPKRDPKVNEILENREICNTNSILESPVNLPVQRTLSASKYVQKFRPEWLKLPEFKDWLIECKLAGDGDMSQAQCKFCGTLLVNNSNNLVRHAISKKHTKNMEVENSDVDSTLEGQSSNQTSKNSFSKSKEEIFGTYVASELKRIKNKKTYEEVKWKILQTLQSAAEIEAEDLDRSTLDGV